MPASAIKYVTFDCYGTLTHFQIRDITRSLLTDRISASQMDEFIVDFSNYRRDEVLGTWKPYRDVLENALARTCRQWNITHRSEDGDAMYQAVPTWGPHPDVVEPLVRLAQKVPLVILSNASNDQIMQNVDKLKAPFHAVYTAEQAGAYKPRLAAFQHMFDDLGCSPQDVAHVLASMRYDLISAHDLRIPIRIYVNRGYEPSSDFYSTGEIHSIADLEAALGM